MLLMSILQDPTAQAEIDNFMVQQLDGTKNEWGWCKQKVFTCHMSVCTIVEKIIIIFPLGLNIMVFYPTYPAWC
jgi:hypothetical protein